MYGCSYRETSTSYLVDYTPLICVYLVLFLYIYFSVQKIEMVSCIDLFLSKTDVALTLYSNESLKSKYCISRLCQLGMRFSIW